MYPTLPFGPLSLPTSPLFALFAVMLTLDVAGRFAKRVDLHPDDVWNTGLVALAGGLLVARLWNVIQFWTIYQATPLLIVSPRPSGFALWPGLGAAVVAGYLYMLYRALDPGRIAAAASIGVLAGAALLAVSGHMTGAILGLPTSVPWALPYFDQLRHPVGLYRAFGLLAACAFVWIAADVGKPGRIIVQVLFAYGLVRVFTDGYLDAVAHVNGVRWSQLIALGITLASALNLTATRQPGPDSLPLPNGAAPEQGANSDGLGTSINRLDD